MENGGKSMQLVVRSAFVRNLNKSNKGSYNRGRYIKQPIILISGNK